ncbi:MAG TPA: response regulator [Candidatus Cloacimonadota bacterium]|nr:response regulator [Candidatus Cloacimonadota bacterium]HPS37940.1 response regulator [Candidatus Cloacimonadota bacterium]
MPNHPPRILVVDDSLSIVNSLSKILEISGYVADVAYNGSDALRKLQASNYDLVICDIEMPGITGLDFLERVRSEYDRDLDVILMTGFLDQEYFIRAIRSGASDFIRKPIDSKHIVRSIQTILDKKRSKYDLGDFFVNLDQAQMSFVIDPKHFSKFSISKVFNIFLMHNFKFNHNLLNELLIVIDEMIYNSFIHGTLNLSYEERLLDHESLQQLIACKLQDPVVADRRIFFTIEIDQINRSAAITVQDQGNGFDYESWLLKILDDQHLNVEEHGRGISLLYHLTDKVEFSDHGRRVKITKRIDGNNTPA